ncbi:MAG: 4Fe-4S binding protein [Holdemanella sp.]|nr:4Fe-4S binding protein [Holdemanella sp.]
MNYLQYIVENIHTVIVATVDENGLPVTSAIDMMDYDDSGLYFLTAKGKNFYNRLMNRGYIALTGLEGTDTLSSKTISIRGKVECLGNDLIPKLFKKNPYMAEIYPDEGSRDSLVVFKLYEGQGEWFDLSKKPIERQSFSIGNVEIRPTLFYIDDTCISCGACLSSCPQECIDVYSMPAIISQENCLHCGKCMEVCPMASIHKIHG